MNSTPSFKSVNTKAYMIPVAYRNVTTSTPPTTLSPILVLSERLVAVDEECAAVDDAEATAVEPEAFDEAVPEDELVDTVELTSFSFGTTAGHVRL